MKVTRRFTSVFTTSTSLKTCKLCRSWFNGTDLWVLVRFGLCFAVIGIGIGFGVDRRRHRRRLEHRLRLHIIGPRGVSLNYICTCLSFQVTASACPPRLLPRRLEGHRVRPRPRPGLGIHIDLHLTTRIERHSTSACHSTSDSPSTSPPATASEVSAASKITASASASASTSNK